MEKDAIRLSGFFLLILVVMTAAFFYIYRVGFLIDETAHYREILYLSSGHLTPEGYISMVPGYHYLMSMLGIVTTYYSPSAIRFYTLLLSLACVVVFFLLSNKLSGGMVYSKTYQFVFLPILFPFFFLIYTDVLSLLLVLTSLYLVEDKRYWLAGLLCILAMAVRQNNVVWLGLLFSIVYYDKYPLQTDAIRLRVLLKDTWVLFAGLLVFIVFVVLNGGVVLADRSAHPAFSFHSENLFLFLFVLFALLLPIHLANHKAIYRCITERLVLITVLSALVFVVYWFTFNVNHPYNQPELSYFLRNRIINSVTSSPLIKCLFYLPVLYALLSIAVTPLVRKAYYSMYPLTILFLTSSWLVEPRYYLIPMSLFLAARQRKAKWVEWLTIAILIAFTATVFYGITNQQFFL